MMTSKEKKMLLRVKSNCYKLRRNGQLPFNLYLAVLNLSFESSLEEVKDLKDLCDKYTRVGGYYIRYPDSAYQCDLELKDKGYIV